MFFSFILLLFLLFLLFYTFHRYLAYNIQLFLRFEKKMILLLLPVNTTDDGRSLYYNMKDINYVICPFFFIFFFPPVCPLVFFFARLCTFSTNSNYTRLYDEEISF